MNIRQAAIEDHPILLDIWLRSVRATHDFVSEADIEEFIPMVRDHVLYELEIWALTTDNGVLAGFMGLTGNKLEALFLAPEHFCKGGGRMLVKHARQLYGPLLVEVNEQNPNAVKFYESVGFVVYDRSETDGMGKPYPLLYMRDKDAEIP